MPTPPDLASRGWQVRAATPEDAPALAGLIRLAFAAQEVATDPPPSALRETAESVGALLADVSCKAEGGGLVTDAIMVAGLIWSEVAGGLYIGRLAVHPNYRRLGLARLLLAAAEQTARARGLDRLTLSTRLVLTGNRRLFAAAGFGEVSLQTHQGYSQPTSVVMEKRLGPILGDCRE